VLCRKDGIEIDVGLLANGLAFGVGKNEARHHYRHDRFEMAFWAQALWKLDGFGFDGELARETGKVRGDRVSHVD
jgi:hypothetical protein